MKISSFLLRTSAVAAITLFGIPTGSTAAENTAARPAPATVPVATEARVIVKFKKDAGTVRLHALSARQMAHAGDSTDVLKQRALTLGARHGHILGTGRGISDRMQVVTATGVDSATLARTLAADSEVEYVQVDQRRHALVVPNDPLFGPTSGAGAQSGQWYLKAPNAGAVTHSTDFVSSINAPTAWNLTTGSADIVVAVLDTGVRSDHTDLAGKVLSGYDMVTSTTTARDGNGRDADASDPGDYVTQADVQNDPACSHTEDSSWHGTQVSGLIGAATNNGVGMAGIAWNSKILPVRVLGKCGGTDSDIIAGMRWAAGLPVPGVPTNLTPAKVINLSLGGPDTCPSASPYADAVGEITARGTVIVAAAGNDGGLAVNLPANCTGVIAVTATRHAGSKVGFGNLGPQVAIAAPGGNCGDNCLTNPDAPLLFPVISTFNAGTSTPVSGSAGSTYTDASTGVAGTSFSAPMVAATAALMFSVNPSLTPARLTQLIKSSARTFPTSGATSGTPTCQAPSGTVQGECYCTTSTCGAGMLDAGAAVRAAATTGFGAAGPLQAHITASPSLPGVNSPVTFGAATTQTGAGRSIATYTWTLLDGGGIVNAFDRAADGPATMATPSAGGSFSVRLTVVDDLGASSSEDLIVQVDSSSVQVQASPTSATVGDTVTFSATNLVLNPGRSVASYGWSLVSGGGAVTSLGNNVTSSSLAVVPTAAGTFTVRLTVTDDLGKQATADATVVVSGQAGGTPPASGGGGAVSGEWLLGLGLGALALWLQQRRQSAAADRRHPR